MRLITDSQNLNHICSKDEYRIRLHITITCKKEVLAKGSYVNKNSINRGIYRKTLGGAIP